MIQYLRFDSNFSTSRVLISLMWAVCSGTVNVYSNGYENFIVFDRVRLYSFRAVWMTFTRSNYL